MLHLPIERFTGMESAPLEIVEVMDEWLDEIRLRAAEIASKHGDGTDLENWLEAERQLTCCPPMEWGEAGRDLVIRLAVPGIDGKRLKITALPRTLVVQGPALERPEQELKYSELSHQPLYRRVDLPFDLDLEHISATADRGLLQIFAAKALPRERHVAAAA